MKAASDQALPTFPVVQLLYHSASCLASARLVHEVRNRQLISFSFLVPLSRRETQSANSVTMMVCYSGCIAQINITRLLAPGPGISLKGPVYFAQEFKCIGMCWLCKRSPVIWAPAVRGRLLEHGMLTFWNVFESCVIHLVCFSVVSSAF